MQWTPSVLSLVWAVALSLPMVIISHVLQDCQARAFLIWDAAFSEDVSHYG